MDVEHQARFIEVWDKGDYRLGSTAQRLVDRILTHITPFESINDYGSGTGRAEVEILKRRPTQEINMVDIAPNALESECLDLVAKRQNLHYWISDLSELPDEFPKADWGLCINVLMTVQPEKLESILSEIRRTCKKLFMEVYDFDDVRLGFNQTTVKLNGQQWFEILKKYWVNVKQESSPESKRRYIYICQD